MSLNESIRKQFAEQSATQAPGLLAEIKQQAIANFEQTGLPTLRDEEWKYTSLRSLDKTDFNSEAVSKLTKSELLNLGLLNQIDCNKVVFVNGRLNPELTVWKEQDTALVMTTLKDAATTHSSLFQAHFGKYATGASKGMTSMNTALMQDGLFLFIPKGKQMQLPLMVTHITDAGSSSVLTQARNLIIQEESSSAIVIENYLATGSQPSFTNVVNEIFVGANAQLEHYKVQRASGETYHNNYTQIHQERDTKINQVTLTLDGQWVRNNLHFYMNGENCNSLLYGLYILSGNQFTDNHSRVDHAMPNCFSDEKYKGVLKDKSTAVFNGKIMVHQDAQKTNAYQRNQNILLSKDATVNTKPQLEIFADDVKCTHGATIGQLDEEQLFYLRSRGISEKEATRLLLNAFADDIAEKIRIPELVEILEAEIERKL